MPRSTSAIAAALMAAGFLFLPSSPAAAGQFHGAGAVDDFNCDGVRDEVFLAAHYDVGSVERAGVIIIGFGTDSELVISQNTPGIPGSAETDDGFGRTYASADFNGDGCDELIVGSPGEDKQAGMVTIIEGSPAGPVPSRSVAYTQNTAGVPGDSEPSDGFGATLSAGAISSGQAYLLVGAPGESLGAKKYAGSVYYLRGGKWRAFHQDTPGIAGTAEHMDHFGESLSGSDRFFAVGAPGETISGEDHAGQVHVFSHTIVDGVPRPLAAITQDSTGISGSAEYGDGFGIDVSVVSYQPTASAPIGALVAVGVPNEVLGSDDAAGMAHVLAVTPTGKVTEVSDINQDTSGVADSTQDDDHFGYAVALAVNGSGATATPSTALLAVGVPTEALADDITGALHVFRDMVSPGNGDIWAPNDTNWFDGYWQLNTTSTSLIHGEYDGNPSWEIPWSQILGGQVS
ncbi:FG-GAP repeat protein [Phytomonospora sp. NPDC050363]|uniref:FG-GAP repeat protein n=1 Tax=Phytomonospora sp. NPDC050363 TaxID=3155642 RepID=UPI0033DC5177